ncbi:MAG: DUF2911 domain-containing protein [Cyclobacteriaceae bacterium]
MKKLILPVLLLVALMISDAAMAQKFSGVDKSPADIAWLPGNRKPAPIAKVVYSRPMLKGRELASLTPYGKMWRTGANETTEITFLQDVKFAGNDVKAGTYALYTIPGESNWTVILNSKLNTWGHYQYDETQDVAKAEVSSRKYDGDSIEAFTIAFEDPKDSMSTMYLAWGDTVVEVPIGL